MHLFLFLMCLLPTCMSWHYKHTWCLERPEQGVRYPRTRDTDSRKPPSGCWELKQGSLDEEPMLLATEPILQSLCNSSWPILESANSPRSPGLLLKTDTRSKLRYAVLIAVGGSLRLSVCVHILPMYRHTPINMHILMHVYIKLNDIILMSNSNLLLYRSW